jgi:four helix bundle protein
MEVQNAKVKSQNCSVKVKIELKYRAYHFSLSVVKFVSQLSQNRTYDIISNQLLRAATSVGANIVEAQSGSSKRDFVRFYEIALKSCNETKFWLCLLRDSNLIKDRQKLEILLREAVEISKILGSSILTLKGKRKF